MDMKESERQLRARQVAAEVVAGSKVDPRQLPITPLAGMTNRNYLVTVEGVDYVVRIPGEGTEEYVDRKADEQAARITSDLGVNAPLVHYDAKAGIQITRFIDNSKTMSPELFQDPAAIRRAARSFKKLHSSGKAFLNRFDEREVAEGYMEILRQKKARLPDGYDRVQREADAIRSALAASGAALVSCHNDPAPENLVDTGERVYILDWEFGGNNDPFWDLADLSVETGFTEEQDRVLLEAYLDRPPTPSDYGRVVLQKSLAFLLWTLWGLLQQANKNPRPAYHFASYWDYAMDRFTRCQQIMNADNFPGLMEAVRTGRLEADGVVR